MIADLSQGVVAILPWQHVNDRVGETLCRYSLSRSRHFSTSTVPAIKLSSAISGTRPAAWTTRSAGIAATPCGVRVCKRYGTVTLPNRARNKYAGMLGSRRSDDFAPRLHRRGPEGDVMSAVDGATIERRIRINRPDDENTRCRVSRVRVQPKDFSQRTLPLTTLSTSSVISPQQERTEPSGPRRCRRGAKPSLRREPNMPADLLRALFGNVTVP
jgi:hypothetical protein